MSKSAELAQEARAVLAAWDRIEEAKAGIESLEARLAAIQPHKDAFQAAMDRMRDLVTGAA